MTTIGFVRHGITKWNELGKVQGRSNIPLNKRGKQQAVALANRLALEEKWDSIISSDLERAAETAIIIASRLGMMEIHFDERIREIDCGQIEGTNEEERVSRWGKKVEKARSGHGKF